MTLAARQSGTLTTIYCLAAREREVKMAKETEAELKYYCNRKRDAINELISEECDAIVVSLMKSAFTKGYRAGRAYKEKGTRKTRLHTTS